MQGSIDIPIVHSSYWIIGPNQTPSVHKLMPVSDSATVYHAHAILHQLLAHNVNDLAKKTNGIPILYLAALANTETIFVLGQQGLDGIDVSASTM